MNFKNSFFSYSPFLIPLIMLLVLLSAVATAILFPWKSSSRNTLKHSFNNITTSKEVQFTSGKGRKD